MENTNTRNIILAILGLIVIIGGVVYFTGLNIGVEELNTENKVEENQIKEFGDIDDFVKKDLTEEQKEDLKIILEQRKERQIQIRDILEMAYKKGEMEEAWIEVNKIRETCERRILPFIADSKIYNFENYCALEAGKFEADYVQK